MELADYETINDRRTHIIVRKDWKSFVLDDLRTDFERVPESARRRIQGRIPHFSYHPRSSPSRVLVRTGAHGGQITFMGRMFLGASRPLREFSLHVAARAAGLHVPELIAVKIIRVFPFFCRYLTLTAEIEPSQDLHTWLQSAPPFPRNILLSSVAQTLARMHDAGLYHGDLNTKNILIRTDAPEACTVYLVDLDKSRMFPHPVPTKLRMDNLRRLFRSLEKSFGHTEVLSRTDRARFVRYYLNGSNDARRFMKACGQGLWFHRIGWTMAGAPPAQK